MLKRLISLILAAALCLSLAACGASDPVSGEDGAVEQDNPVQKDTAVQDAEPTREDTETDDPAAETQEMQETPDYEPERFETDTLSWDFSADTGTLTLHGEGFMRSYADELPEWEVHKDEIKTVVLEDGIASVGAYAFAGYLNLTDVQIPDSVEVIDVSAFDYDWELRTITIPSSLKYVGYRAFYNTLLWEPENLIFPEGCEYIGDQAFHSALKSGGTVTLPSTLVYLGQQSFTNSFISDFIVSGDNTVYRSENGAVFTKDGREMLMLAQQREGMAEFRIPDGVEKIYAECFNAIRGIEKVWIPASVTQIEEGAFFSTFDLKEIVVDEANPNYKSQNGLLLSKDGTLLLAWPDGIETAELMIPEGVERIGEYLFYGRMDGSYTVTMPDSVREIGTMSLPFDISVLTLPAGLEKMEDNVFFNGISVDSVSYNGSEADWEKIAIGEGNDALTELDIHMN